MARDDRSPVASLGAVAVVSETGHEFGPHGRDPAWADPGRDGRPAQPEPRQARDHEMEGGRRGVARCSELVDDTGELDDRPRPAVRQEQRCGVVTIGAEMGEDDPLALDLALVQVPGVELGFGARQS